MLNRKIYLVIGLLLFGWGSAFGQIGWTKARLIEKHGINYKEDKTTTGDYFLKYKSAKYDETEGRIEKFDYYIFDKNTDLVKLILVIEPISQVNERVKDLNESFVKMGKLHWRNYAEGLDFVLKIEEDVIIIEITDADK